MQKNWYIVYTKPKLEKKVGFLLTKRKIENFCPLNCRHRLNTKKSKTVFEPLFDSYVFVYIIENDIPQIKQIEGVISLVYWKGEPAVIKDEEIKAIQEFISIYINIRLEKNAVDLPVDHLMRIDKQPSYRRDGNLLMIKNRASKVYLPSMGFTLTADAETGRGRGVEITLGNKEFNLQS